jgi:SAM-dependent methyltransferase
MTDFLNIGCGTRFHPAWSNIDLAPCDRSVRACDLRQGLPFPDRSFDVVYHSHVLEHLPRAAAIPFLSDVARVLRPQGMLRVVVPDLERIARLYLESLEGVIAGDAAAKGRYDWILFELYDQAVRERSGGDVADYLRMDHIPEQEFVRARWGAEAVGIIAGGKTNGARQGGPSKRSGGDRFASIRRAARHPLTALRFAAARITLGSRYEWLQLGRFRRAGEIHLWMYDRYSLGRLLETCGFLNARVVGAVESDIPGWTTFHLDTDPDGTIAKPDSLFMEARKP